MILFERKRASKRERKKVREHVWQGEAEGEGEGDAWLRQKPNVGLDPRTPGS